MLWPSSAIRHRQIGIPLRFHPDEEESSADLVQLEHLQQPWRVLWIGTIIEGDPD